MPDMEGQTIVLVDKEYGQEQLALPVGLTATVEVNVDADSALTPQLVTSPKHVTKQVQTLL